MDFKNTIWRIVSLKRKKGNQNFQKLFAINIEYIIEISPNFKRNALVEHLTDTKIQTLSF